MNKLIESFKAFYFRNPYWTVFLVSALLTLPWLPLGEFYSKGEPREAALATYMLNSGNWILPTGYADEIAYKPPFMHWFIALFSLITGRVTEMTARMPSALGLIGISLGFFALAFKRKSPSRAILATLILVTGFEMHRSGIEARVDMFLSFFMISGLLAMYKWEEKELRGFPVLLPLLLGGAALVKGPVGILLPCLVFGIYLLLLQKYSLWKIIYKNVLVALPALAILLVWYVLAYQQAGEHFLQLVYAENFGRFLGQDKKALGISYDLGHKGPFWYYIPAIITGFLPWSLVLIFFLFIAPYRKMRNYFGSYKGQFFSKIAGLDRMLLFSIVSVVIILGFYAIPSSKRSVYIIPAYPFAAYLLTLLYEWVMENRPSLIRILNGVVLSVSGILLALVTIFYFVNLEGILSRFVHKQKSLYDIDLFSNGFQHPTFIGYVVWVILLAAFVYVWKIKRDRNIRIVLVSTLALYISTLFFLEGFAYPVYKNGHSSRPFAEQISTKYDLKGKTYVMNDLNSFFNPYGLNFYLGNYFRNFDKEQPSGGYFITADEYIGQIREKYKGKYQFVELERTPNANNDYQKVIVLYQIVKL
ncbi:ArnT family glycosyltransferase [Parabacteroides sp. FAFU027]|uniref:ArnT family glycosyltransferase n=1 Tax=Parabacteroides sp. FAFU027 TaxID=2922715 RepID=UPI001FAFC032|nr:glycosyltransferase family 39 protein [Parabacteroides sp. FAFU027]